MFQIGDIIQVVNVNSKPFDLDLEEGYFYNYHLGDIGVICNVGRVLKVTFLSKDRYDEERTGFMVLKSEIKVLQKGENNV